MHTHSNLSLHQSANKDEAGLYEPRIHHKLCGIGKHRSVLAHYDSISNVTAGHEASGPMSHLILLLDFVTLSYLHERASINVRRCKG